ncbi:hypothetical protein ACFXQA_01760 [Microbacterium sp. P07]|uniref:S1 family peptidase n=1 Tax=Microbacterium sp. P07 TaxID=3366952 RepID=UPI003744C07C
MTLSKRHAAAIAAIAVALSGAFIPSVAVAGEQPSAPTSGPAFDAAAKELLNGEGVEAVAVDGDGRVVVYTASPDDLDLAASEFVEGNSNVSVRVLDAPFTATDDTDVVGGAGYLALDPEGPVSATVCSIGFTGWNATGGPAIISAGHCADDGVSTASVLTLPTGDPAGGATDSSQVEPTYLLGELGFAQFGGPGDTVGEAGSADTVDISAWDVVNDELTLLPAITDWTTAASEDLSASATPVRSVGTAQLGPIEKSGRTTGLTVGTVDAVEGWALVDGRQVYGFLATIAAGDGDSGGALYQGSTAVGIISGGATLGGVSIVWGADLQAGLAAADGYSVSLFVDPPVLSSPVTGGEVMVGGAISGTGPAEHTLVVTPDGAPSFDVPIDASGQWSFAAPDAPGDFGFTLYAQEGFDVSKETAYTVGVLPAPPVIANPADGALFALDAAPTGANGSGREGARVIVTLDGAVVGETEVVDGAWSVPFAAVPGPGAHTLVARQTVNGQSNSATVTFEVAAAPVVTGGGNLPSTLPATGLGDLTPLATSAGMLLFAGGLLVAVRQGSRRLGRR